MSVTYDLHSSPSPILIGGKNIREPHTFVTSIRLKEDKRQVFEEFKELVKDQLHSDMCYVLGELIEVFTVSVKQLPQKKGGEIMLVFPKQNVQINMGCTFHYNVRKPKRMPPPETTEPDIQLSKNHFFPLLIEEWETMKESSREFWRDRLREKGIIKNYKSNTLLHRIKMFFKRVFRRFQWK